MSSASDYIQKIRLSVQKEANSAAESRKFRAPTRDTVYDVNYTVKNNIHIDNFKNIQPKHNTFKSGKYVPHS